MLVDSHCHLDRLRLNDGETVEQMVANATERGIGHMLCVSVTLDEYLSMRQVVAPFNNVSVSCGVHPLDLDTPFEPERLREYAADDTVVAIGETGLDYYYSKDNKSVQQEAFAGHIDIANQLNKPLIIHTRDAREDTIAIMKQQGAEQCGGVMHCFTESWEMAKKALDLGFYISFSGIVTFRNAESLRDVAKRVPMDRLLVETDSPYLAPVPYRGKSNQPAYVKEVAEFVADLKGIRYEIFEQQTTDNFFTLFNGANRL